MAITTRDQLISALAGNSSRVVIDKASISGIATGLFYSYWRATGQPAQGAIPTAVATCNSSTVGGLAFTQQSAPTTSYLAYIDVALAAQHTMEIHDRLAHMGGLSGIVTTAQTVGINLETLGSTDSIGIRKGDSDYSDVQWWLEWYTTTGATVANAVINVTYNDGSTGNLNTLSLAASRPASLMISLNNLNPSTTRKYIKAVNSVTLSASTGTAGNFGVTATRQRSASFIPLANARGVQDWAQLGLPEIYNDSCLFPLILFASGTATTIRASGKIAHG